MYLGEDLPTFTYTPGGPIGRAAGESIAGGGWFGDALETGSRVIRNILPGIADIISAGKGKLYGPAAPSGGSLTYRYGYPDSYPGQPLPPSKTPEWLIPATVGISGVILFSMFTAKRRKR